MYNFFVFGQFNSDHSDSLKAEGPLKYYSLSVCGERPVDIFQP